MQGARLVGRGLDDDRTGRARRDGTERIEELNERREEWAAAAALYEREAAILAEAEPERRKQVWLCAAELARQRLDDPARALRAFEEASRISALAPGPLRAQAELYRRTGATERFAKTFTDWCDDPRSGATAAEHLELTGVLVGLGRHADALARARRAVSVDARNPDAWATVARLEEQRSHPTEAAEAWERAGLLRVGPEAAAHLCDAALLVEQSDPEACVRRLRRAVEIDPASARARAHLARVAAAQGCVAEAETNAARALDLSTASSEPLPRALQLETALVGGRMARAQDRLEAAVLLFSAATALAPENLEALEAIGELLFERGDLAGARETLEARLAVSAADAHRAARLAMLGSVLELSGETADALARFREAVAEDAGCSAGHAGVARICEKSGQIGRASCRERV